MATVAHQPPEPALVPKWVIERLQWLFKEPAHYETSYYGPINMLLVTYFPSNLGFMVKPQARLRQQPTSTRTSTDSYGQEVDPSNDHDNPDFMISIGFSNPTTDTPLLIVEVKREKVSELSCASQIDRYCRWAIDYIEYATPWRDVEIRAILVAGSTSTIYRMSSGRAISVMADERDIGTLSDKIIGLLKETRESYAGRRDVVAQ